MKNIKSIKLFYILLLLPLFIQSCSKDIDGTDKLSTTLESLNLSFSESANQPTTFTIESNRDWHIDLSETKNVACWVEILPIHGKPGKTVVTINVDDNSDDVVRVGYANIATDDKSIQISFVQESNNAYTPSSNQDLIVDIDGGDFSINHMTTEDDIVIVSKPDWISKIQAEVEVGKIHHFTATAMPSDTEYGRIGEIVFKDNNSDKTTIYTVSQGWSIYNGAANSTDASISVLETKLKLVFGDDYSELTKLKVVGEMNEADFFAINSILDIDLSEVTVVGKITVSESRDDLLEYADGNAIPLEAFYEAPIKHFKFPKGITTIGESAFASCEGLTGSLIIPEGVTKIGSTAFWGCTGFTGDLVLAETVTSIGALAFAECNNFAGTLTLPETMTSIEESAFFKCYSFTGDLTIPKGLTSIEPFVFAFCYGFNGKLTIPEGVIEIGEYAFNDCVELSGNLIFPKTITRIDSGAFENCRNLSGELIIPETMTYISGYTFSGCESLTGTLIIPEGVTKIYYNAFEDCIGFTGNLVIPEGVTMIGSAAFKGCTGFTGNLIIPEKVTTLGDRVFYKCTGFTGNLTIPEKVTKLGDLVFYKCTGLTGNLTIPKGVTSVGSNVFRECPGLTTIIVNWTDDNEGVIPEISEIFFPTQFKSSEGEELFLSIPAGKSAAYNNVLGWSSYNMSERE